MKFLVDWKEDCHGSCGNFVQANIEEVFEVEGNSPEEAEQAALKVALGVISARRKKSIGVFVPRVTTLVDEDGKVYESVKAGKDAAGKDKLVWQQGGF